MRKLLTASLVLLLSSLSYGQQNNPVDSVLREAQSLIEQFPSVENQIRKFYEAAVFHTSSDKDFKMSDICTADFIRRLRDADDSDVKGYATWLLRSGFQDGQDEPSKVLSVVPGPGNTVIVYWSDLGIKGSTTLSMVKADGQWKIDNATVPEGFNPL